MLLKKHNIFKGIYIDVSQILDIIILETLRVQEVAKL
jgi:hypothetical protein